MSKSWERVHGPNCEPQHKEREEKNSSVLKNGKFIKACELAGIPATRRQASKWNHSRGLAFNSRFKANNAVSG